MNPDKATMNLGFHESTSPEQIRGTTLHEFGHTLDFVHEHQSPAATIEWDEAAVVRDNKHRTRKAIDHNLLVPVPERQVTYSRFDPESIMMYPVKSSWTKNGWSAKNNNIPAK